jgi:hypothetical protein
VPIKSYLAQAVAGEREQLTRRLRALPGCLVLPAANRDVVVLVTDTLDDSAEEAMEIMLARVPGLQCLTLVAGLADAEGSPRRLEGDDDPS